MSLWEKHCGRRYQLPAYDRLFVTGFPLWLSAGDPPQIDSARVRQSLEDEGF